MMKRADQIELYEWAEITRARATLLQKIYGLGGDQRIYFEQARSADSTNALRSSLQTMAGAEQWSIFRIRIPVDMVGMIDAAMERALRVVDPDNPDPERLEDADIRFRCFEEITRSYLNAPPVPV